MIKVSGWRDGAARGVIRIVHFVAVMAVVTPCSAADVWLNGVSPGQGDRIIEVVATTLMHANVQLLIDGKDRLYCEPLTDSPLRSSDLWEIIAEDAVGGVDLSLATLALMDGLKRRYPC